MAGSVGFCSFGISYSVSHHLGRTLLVIRLLEPHCTRDKLCSNLVPDRRVGSTSTRPGVARSRLEAKQ